MKKPRLFTCALTLAAVTSSVAVSRPAHADTVSPNGKGIAGGALIGGELVCFGEAIFGVRSTAAYLVGGGVGAVAGGVGGYFVEQAVSDGRIPAYMLAVGLAALIPAVVVTLDATRFRPTEGAREDKPATNLPASDPGTPGGSSVVGADPASTPPGGATPAAPTPPADTGTNPSKNPSPSPSPTPGAPHSLLDLGGGELRLGMPIPELRPVIGMVERRTLGPGGPDAYRGARGSELRFPVVRVAF